MYTFYLGEKEHAIKNSWEELSQDEFITISGLLTDFMKRKFSLFELKVRLVFLLLGVNIRRMKFKEGDHLSENTYLLTRHMDFFYRIHYEDEKAFGLFAPDLRKELLTIFPEDLPESPEVKVARRMKKHVRIHTEFGKNLLPEVKYGRGIFKGYSFSVNDGIAQTSLSAIQFSEAQKIVARYSETESAYLLNLLCGILYQDSYSEEMAGKLSVSFAPIDHQVKEAILLNFCAITNIIIHSTKYSILFDRPVKGKKAGKYSMGLADNMYMLSKKGYGDSSQMESANLFKFFDLLIKELTDQARELYALGKKKPEIAELMNLTLTQVNDLL